MIVIPEGVVKDLNTLTTTHYYSQSNVLTNESNHMVGWLGMEI